MPKFEPKPAGDLTEAPDWLSEGQLASWIYALTNAPAGLLKRIDRGALLAWVVAENWTKATTNMNDPGVPAASPCINISNQQAKILLKAASELGFTPVSRPRIAAGASLLPAAPEWNVDHSQQKAKPSLQEFLASKPAQQVKH